MGVEEIIDRAISKWAIGTDFSVRSAPAIIAALREAGYAVVPREVPAAIYDDEELGRAIHAELKRQQQFTIAKHGIVALAEAPFVTLVYEAMIAAAEAGT